MKHAINIGLADQMTDTLLVGVGVVSEHLRFVHSSTIAIVRCFVSQFLLNNLILLLLYASIGCFDPVQLLVLLLHIEHSIWMTSMTI